MRVKPVVLIVDDEPHWRESFKHELAPTFDVVTATTTSAAIAALKSHAAIDIVICDIMMQQDSHTHGVQSGFKVLEDLRSSAKPNTPFLVYSSYLSDFREEFRELGASFISKGTTSPGSLVTRVEEIIDNSKREAEARKEQNTVVQSIKQAVMEEMERYAPIRERTLHIPGEGNFELIKPLMGFKRDIERQLSQYNYERNVFLMMKFRDNNRDLADFILENLKKYRLNGVRADASEWNITRNVYNPIAVLYCCKYGIALFDEPEQHQAYSPNVAYELGMMHYQSKDCLILKHSTLPQVPFDLIKDLYVSYDKDLSVRPIVQGWIKQVRRTGE